MQKSLEHGGGNVQKVNNNLDGHEDGILVDLRANLAKARC